MAVKGEARVPGLLEIVRDAGACFIFPQVLRGDALLGLGGSAPSVIATLPNCHLFLASSSELNSLSR